MLFTDQERRIFGPYHNGTEEVFGDPLAIDRRLRAYLGKPEEVLAAYNGDNPLEALHAAEKFHAAIAFAFEVATFDPRTGAGFLEADLVKLWNAFQQWLEGKGQRAESLATTSEPTAATGSVGSSAQHSPAVRAATPPTLRSLSMPSGNPGAGPGQ